MMKANKYVVIKSTVEVGTTDRFSKKYNNLVFIFNPNFSQKQIL